MKVVFTNYEGDLDALCSFCNKPQRMHFIRVGSPDGQQYAHHHPCDEQMKLLGAATAAPKGIVPRLLRQLFPSRAA